MTSLRVGEGEDEDGGAGKEVPAPCGARTVTDALTVRPAVS